MPSNEVFLDTSAMIAIISRGDELHHKTMTLYRDLLEANARLVTSEWVLAEFLGWASRIEVRQSAVSLVERIRRSSRSVIVSASPASWASGFEFFVRHKDKTWSFVDCSSMLICSEREITRVLTHDKDFEQFGLQALLRT